VSGANPPITGAGAIGFTAWHLPALRGIAGLDPTIAGRDPTAWLRQNRQGSDRWDEESG